MPMTAWPRLLLVEDDDTSAAFLSQALALLPARVAVAGSLRQARELESAERHALWIIDAHLPDGSGLECLQALSAMREGVPALAVTAGAPREEIEALWAGGFAQVLMKPVSMADLHAAARRVLALRAREEGATGYAQSIAPLPGKQPVWEQQRSLAAMGGNAVSLARLRQLFLSDLPAQRVELGIAQASGDAAVVGALLHKLRAACGFVGASRLAQAVEAMSAAPLDTAALQAFEFAAEDTTTTPPPQP
jgi:DNA-binding response OmpR family regulator